MKQDDGSIVERDLCGQVVGEYRFTIPAEDYRAFVARFDHMTERITSGLGSTHAKHYERMMAMLLAFLREKAPGADWLTKADWHRTG